MTHSEILSLFENNYDPAKPVLGDLGTLTELHFHTIAQKHTRLNMVSCVVSFFLFFFFLGGGRGGGYLMCSLLTEILPSELILYDQRGQYKDILYL